MSLFGVALENVLVGLISVFLVGSLSKLYEVGKQKSLERRFPVQGEYIGRFEENVGDETQYRTAYTHIEQQGSEITGVSEFKSQQENRTSRLDGEITDDGSQIYGRYYSENPHDDYMGSFFLSIGHNRRLEGFWAGYVRRETDGEEGRVLRMDSGPYKLFPMKDDFVVSEGNGDELPRIASIANQVLPSLPVNDLIRSRIDDEFDESVFLKIVKDTGGSNLVDRLVEKAFASGPLPPSRGGPTHSQNSTIGFAVCECFDVANSYDSLPLSLPEFPSAFDHVETVGFVHAVGIEEAHQQRGVGTRLVEECVDSFHEQNVSIVCSLVERGDPLESILYLNGFELQAQVSANHVRDDSYVSEFYDDSKEIQLFTRISEQST